MTDFLPGGLFVHWDAIRELPKPSALLNHNRIGMFHSITGRLHRKYEYRWFPSRDAATIHRLELAKDEGAASVALKSAPFKVSSIATYLRPAPFGWLRPLFEPMDWRRFESRDPTQRRIPPTLEIDTNAMNARYLLSQLLH